MSADARAGRFAEAPRLVSRLVRQPIYIVLLGLLVWITVREPDFATWPVFIAFLKRSAPLMVLAAGELFVIVSGEFDLSVGSLITVVVVVAARLINNDPTQTGWVIPLLLAIGLLVGWLNGVITTRLRVPSFISTLGMLLVLDGAALFWTGGSPRGAVTPNFRVYGRDNLTGLPVVGILPYGVIVLAGMGILASLILHRSTFGRQLFAAGGNPRAAALSGVSVVGVRTLAFVLSGLFAAVAGILIGGLFPLTHHPGLGYEFQAISAVVLGGAVLGGGRGSMPAVMAGALTLQALFNLLNVLGLATSLREAVQGLIIIAAVAPAAYRQRRAG